MSDQHGSINIQPIGLECVCTLRKDDPLAAKSVLTPDDLDNAPMAALFKEHLTTRNAHRVFAEADKRFRVRFETSVLVPALTIVEQGAAYALIDQISAASYRLYRGDAGVLTFRPFRPRIPYDIAIVTPAHRPPSRLAAAFCDRIEQEVTRFIEVV